MALPTIVAPPEAPVFLAEGHEIEELSRYAQVPMQTGHSRARPVLSQNERMVSVRWFLDGPALAAVYEWYEGTLQAGTRLFAARVARQGGDPTTGVWPSLAWWTARWVEFETQMLPRPALLIDPDTDVTLTRGVVSGRIYLIEGPFAEGPDLGALAMEIRAPLLGTALPTIPADLAMEISVALDGFVDETS